MTPCEKLGYKVGDIFVITGDEITGNKKGRLITLYRDDGTHMPLFLGLKYGYGCYHLVDIEK